MTPKHEPKLYESLSLWGICLIAVAFLMIGFYVGLYQETQSQSTATVTRTITPSEISNLCLVASEPAGSTHTSVSMEIIIANGHPLGFINDTQINIQFYICPKGNVSSSP